MTGETREAGAPPPARHGKMHPGSPPAGRGMEER